MAKKTQQQQARHLMVSNGWAQLMKAWQISVTAGGRRSTTGGGKKRVAKAGWDSSPREKPRGRQCHWRCGYGALLSVYISHKLGAASLGASHRSLVMFWKSHPMAWPWGRCFGHRGCPARLGPGEPLGTAAGGLSPFSEPLAEL